MQTKREVVDYLKKNLGYCGCASENVVSILLETLDIIDARSKAILNNVDLFQEKTKELVNTLKLR